MAGHIIHKPTSSRLNLPSAPVPNGPPVTTNAPFPIGRSPRCSKVIWGFAGFLGIGKFTFPLVQMTGDDTVGDRLLVALHVFGRHLRSSSTADCCFYLPT
ncbi:Adenosine deaminase domain-containing protein 1, partial [Scomber scombrus]